MSVGAMMPCLKNIINLQPVASLTPSTAPIFEVRLNQNFVENLPRRNTTITAFHAVSKEGTGLLADFPNFCYRGCFFFPSFKPSGK